MEYTGERNSDGKPNGQGTMNYPSGATYTGAFKDDKRNGQGTKTWADGATYIGEWMFGRRHGQGTLTLDSKSSTGEWKYGELEQ